MKRNVTYLLIPLLALLAACLPDPLEVKGIPEVKPQIVVSSQIIPDQSLVVLLTKSFGALDASGDSDPEELLASITLNDALVVVTGPFGSDTLQLLDNGFYGGVTIPFVAGEEYHLFVNSASLGEVTATTMVKPRVSFAEIQADLFLNGYGDTLAQITYELKDPAGPNRYMLNVQEVEREDVVENLLNPRAFTRLVEDTEFDGESFGESFRVFPRDYAPGDTVAVSLSNISEEYYQFMKLRQDNRYSFIEYLSEPVNYPSNIVNGKGYFNLYIPDVRFFVLE